jgi:hypothetical protein
MQHFQRGSDLYNASASPQRLPDSTEWLSVDGSTLALIGARFDTVAARIPFREDFLAEDIGVGEAIERRASLIASWLENIKLSS